VTERAAVGGTMRTLAHAVGIYLRAAPASAVLRVAASLATSLAPVTTAWLTKVVLDQLSSGSRPGRSMLPAAAALAATIGLLAVVQHLVRYADQEMGRRVAAYTQDRLFVAVGRLPGIAQLEDPAVHDRLRLAQQATTMAPQQLANALLAMVQSALTAAGFLVSLATLSPLLVGLVALSAAPALWAQLSLARARAGMMLAASPRLRRQFFYSGLLLDLRAAKEIRLFGLGDFFRGRMLAELASAQALERRQDGRTLRLDSLLSLLTAVVSGVALVVGVARIARNGSAGDLSVLIAALAGVQSGLASAIAQVANMSQTLVLFDHYLYVTARLGDGPTRRRAAPAQRPAAAAARPAPASPLHRGIELRDVWFRYHAGHDWVLRGVNMFIPAGRSVALVGANGAGKSTLVKLLCQLYEAQHGQVTWDGIDLREIDPAELRRRIAVVFQDYMNYDMSARDNIGVGNLDAIGDEPRLHQAAAFAGIHEALSRLPMGYDTTLSRAFLPDTIPTAANSVGAVRSQRASRPRHRPAAIPTSEGAAGVLLSGGQWQRVALARAVLRDDADMLILDEPSAGLDVEAEAAVHARFQRLRQGRTSLLISHRMNTIRSADLIVVLDAGRVVEQGTHQELMAADTRYAQLFRTQASGYQLAGNGQGPMAGEHASRYP
jgi:ATP-binding cassette subfamily B protein